MKTRNAIFGLHFKQNILLVQYIVTVRKLDWTRENKTPSLLLCANVLDKSTRLQWRTKFVWQEVTDLKSQREIAKITEGENSVIARKL
jgi:hypothetical protein